MQRKAQQRVAYRRDVRLLRTVYPYPIFAGAFDGRVAQGAARVAAAGVGDGVAAELAGVEHGRVGLLGLVPGAFLCTVHFAGAGLEAFGAVRQRKARQPGFRGTGRRRVHRRGVHDVVVYVAGLHEEVRNH